MTIWQALKHHSLTLSVVGIVVVGILAIVYDVTFERIAREKSAHALQKVTRLLGDRIFDNDLLQSCLLIQDARLHPTKAKRIYRAMHENRLQAFIAEVTAPGGYSGEIDLIIALHPSGEILGVDVIAHQETPGLGDKIEAFKSDWLKQFLGLSIHRPPLNDWRVKQDGGSFDAITGATITPRAVIQAIASFLSLYKNHQTELTTLPANCADDAMTLQGNTNDLL